MDDITNNINNVGKPIPQRRVDIRFTLKELRVIQALAQNPHEYYQSNEELMEVAEGLFNSIKMVLDYHQRN